MRTAEKVRLKTPGEIEAMAEAGRAAAVVLREVRGAAKLGVSLLDLEAIAREGLKREGARPALLGYQPGFSKEPYQYATCLSLNDEIIHATPRPRLLKDGDVLGIDLVAEVDGWHADTAWTVLIGEGAPRSRKLLEVTERSMWIGIEKIRPGATLGDIGSAVERYVQRNGFAVLKEMCGHGVGTAVHEPGLDCANYGRAGAGRRLEVGMTFCVEPMVTTGSGKTKHRKTDPWAVITIDGGLGAHFEHTVAVVPGGVRVLTDAGA